MGPLSELCPFCGYEVPDRESRCPECGRVSVPLNGGGFRSSMGLLLLLNAVLLPLVAFATLICVGFAASNAHWDISMTLVVLGLLATLVGLGGATVGRRHAGELVLPRNRLPRIFRFWRAPACGTRRCSYLP